MKMYFEKEFGSIPETRTKARSKIREDNYPFLFAALQCEGKKVDHFYMSFTQAITFEQSLTKAKLLLIPTHDYEHVFYKPQEPAFKNLIYYLAKAQHVLHARVEERWYVAYSWLENFIAPNENTKYALITKKELQIILDRLTSWVSQIKSDQNSKLEIVFWTDVDALANPRFGFKVIGK